MSTVAKRIHTHTYTQKARTNKVVPTQRLNPPLPSSPDLSVATSSNTPSTSGLYNKINSKTATKGTQTNSATSKERKYGLNQLDQLNEFIADHAGKKFQGFRYITKKKDTSVDGGYRLRVISIVKVIFSKKQYTRTLEVASDIQSVCNNKNHTVQTLKELRETLNNMHVQSEATKRLQRTQGNPKQHARGE